MYMISEDLKIDNISEMRAHKMMNIDFRFPLFWKEKNISLAVSEIFQ